MCTFVDEAEPGALGGLDACLGPRLAHVGHVRTRLPCARPFCAGLMTLEAASVSGPGGSIDSAWRGAEAYHFWLLAHRQLYAGRSRGEEGLRLRWQAGRGWGGCAVCECMCAAAHVCMQQGLVVRQCMR